MNYTYKSTQLINELPLTCMELLYIYSIVTAVMQSMYKAN